ncbi:hypothetical protein NW756_004646 [Fusarium oxysporum]|nr:hypothetical protein NW763_011186 [Fusarium oxysporum]KAJ4065371.1 hypothetical protein NW753_003805 [Fusarium oxysporum]KAJ4095826.1 hypothetical protein NW756_004646 [Fusarium oxysporum]
MTSFTLTVAIDKAILNTQSDDKLVIARKVNGTLNAVFDGYSIASSTQWKKLLSTTEFKWSENFKVFLVSSVKPGDSVIANTNEVEIAPDYLSKYANSQLGDAEKQAAGSFAKPGSFGIADVPMQLHAGVKMSTAGGSWSTIYVDQKSHVGKTKITLQPQNEYFLMWKNEVSTEAIWALSETDGQKVVFANGETSKKIRYGYAKPDAPTPDEEPSWY